MKSAHKELYEDSTQLNIMNESKEEGLKVINTEGELVCMLRLDITVTVRKGKTLVKKPCCDNTEIEQIWGKTNTQRILNIE